MILGISTDQKDEQEDEPGGFLLLVAFALAYLEEDILGMMHNLPK